MKKLIFLPLIFLFATLSNATSMQNDYTKLIQATMVQSDNMAASVENNDHKIETISTILEDGSIKTEFVVWAKN